MAGKRIWLALAVILTAMFLSYQGGVSAEETKKETTPEYVKLMHEGQALLGKGDAAGAKTALEKAQRLAPKDSEIMRSLVEANLVAKADDAAEELLVKILTSEDYKDIKDWSTSRYYSLAQNKGGVDPALKKLEAAGKRSRNVGLHRAIAEGYVRLGDWNKVAEVYEKLAKDNPKEPGLSTRLIDAYMLSRNYEGVIKILEPAVKANPNDTGSSDVLAQAYVRSGKKDEALALYKEKAIKDPNSPGLRGRYAQALMDLGYPEASLAEWGAAFKLDPSNLLFKQKMAEANMELGKAKEARKDYVELLKLIPAKQASFKEVVSARIKDIDSMGKKK